MDELIKSFFEKADFPGITVQYFAEKILDSGVSKIKKMFTEHSRKITKIGIEENPDQIESKLVEFEFNASDEVILKHVFSNLTASEIWSRDVNFNQALKSKLLEKIFVDIDLYLSPLKYRFTIDEDTPTIKSSEISKYLDSNVLIYGGPGAGKTTLMKNICRSLLKSSDSNHFSCPIVIRFRELNYSELKSKYGDYTNLYRILLSVLGIIIEFEDSKSVKIFNSNLELIRLTVTQFLEESNILLLFDGFDEIPDEELKNVIEKDFQTLALSLKSSRFIITSRNGEFKLNLSNTNTFEICPLTDPQILKLAKNWLTYDKQAKDLFNKIKDSPYYDTTLRPLTMSHLCAIYERRKTIPPKPRYVYDLVIQLLLETWDSQRGIVRASAYADFYIEKKKEFLAHLSFCFSFELRKSVFSSEDIRSCYNRIYKRHGLPVSHAKKVVSEIESHSGILIQSGYDTYQFSHKSLQEFLTAKYLFSLSSVPDIEIVKRLPNEMAIAITLSGSPNSYFYTFINKRKSINDDYWEIFLNRLIEEKPDFTEDPVVIGFFLVMIEEGRGLLFINALRSLLDKTNLEITIPAFFKKYYKYREFDDKIVLNHKEMDVAVDKRGFLPGTIPVLKEVMLILDKNGKFLK